MNVLVLGIVIGAVVVWACAAGWWGRGVTDRSETGKRERGDAGR